MKTTLALFVAVIAAGGVLFAQGQSPASSQGQPASVAEVVKTRQKGLKALGAAFKTIRDELKADAPDAAKIQSASTDITQAAGAIDKWFPAGTGPDSGVKTDAKPEVWTDPAGFATAREAFVREANKWVLLGNSTDAAAWKEGAASLGQSCKGCHDKFRVKKE
ncbi:MAG TPA: cytochrome c [Steroidobacteraceae bacterium]|nr:cytochrome c [Steroidobacteraceae bacterium]